MANMKDTVQRLNFELSFSADSSKARKDIQDLKKQLDGIMNNTTKKWNYDGISKELKEASGAAANLKAHLTSAMNPQTGKLDLGMLNKSFKDANVDIDYFRKKLSGAGLEGKKAFSTFAQSILQAEVPLKKSSKLLTNFSDTLAKTARWQISSSIIHGFMGSIQSAFHYAKDLNESLNNIRIVTGQNTEQMAQFAEAANKAAQELSTTTTKYTDASLIYYQQGLSDEEVKRRTDVTVKMANVSRQSVEEVSNQMTSVWNNFNKQGDQAEERFADVMTALGAATASSSSEIAEGLSKFAGIADTIGLSFDYAASALATITATSRESADVVGTALKTIFGRMEGLKQSKTLEDGTDLNKYSEGLAKIGVNIKTAGGELKNMDAILEETGEKWKGLSQDQKIATAQTVAGIRQYNQFMTLMDNWDKMQENLGTSKKSTGTLQKQADTYAESWEAAEARVTAAAEKIYSALINDKFFIGLNDLLAGALGVISDTIKGLGGIGGVLTTILSLVTKIMSKNLSSGIDKFLYNFKDPEKIAAQQRQEATASLSKLSEEGETNPYATLVTSQQALLRNAERLTEQEKITAQILLEQNKARADNVNKLREEERAKKIAYKEGTIKDANVIMNKAGGVDKNTKETVKEKLKEYHTLTNDLQRISEISKEVDKILEGTFDPSDLEPYQKELDDILTRMNEVDDGIDKEFIEKLEKTSSESRGIGSGISDKEGAKFLHELGADLDEGGDAYNIRKTYERRMQREIAFAINSGKNGVKNSGEVAEEIVNNTSQAFHEMEEATKNADQAQKDLDADVEKTAKTIDEFDGKKMTMGEKIVGITQSFMSLASAIQAIQGLGDIWSDEDLSNGEKILSTITTLGFILPSIMSAFTSFNGILAATTAAESATAAGATTMGTAINASLGPVGWIALAATALVAGLGIIIGVLDSLTETVEDKIKKTSEAVEGLRDRFNETKQGYEELKQSLTNYNDAYNSIKNMTAGTQEWKEAVTELNNQVLDLIKQYPELADKVENVNGIFRIRQQDQEEVLNNQFKNVQEVQTELNNEENSLALLNQQKALKDYAHSKVEDNISKASFKGIDSELKWFYNSDFNLGSFHIGPTQAVKDRMEENVQDNFEDFVIDYNKNGEEIFLNNKKLDQNSERLRELVIEASKTREQIALFNNNTIKNLMEDNNINKDENFNKFAGAMYGTELKQRKDELLANVDSLRSLYASQKGYTHTEKDKYIDKEGKEITITDEEAAASVATKAISENFDSIVKIWEEKFGDLRERLNSIGEQRNNDETLSTFTSVATTGVYDKDKISLNSAKQLSKLANKNYSDDFFKNNLGITNPEAITQARENIKKYFTTAVGDVKKGSKNIVEGLSSSVKQAYENIGNDPNLTNEAKSWYADLLKTAFAKGNLDEVNKAIEGQIKEGDFQKFADAVNGIDFASEEEFTEALKRNKVQVKDSSAVFDALSEVMRENGTVAKDLAGNYKDALDASKSLKTGDEVSPEDFGKITSFNKELANFFTLTAEGTYRLTGEANAFHAEMQKTETNRINEDVNETKNTIDKLYGVTSEDFDKIKNGTLFTPPNLEKVDPKKILLGRYEEDLTSHVSTNFDFIEEKLNVIEALSENQEDIANVAGWREDLKNLDLTEEKLTEINNKAKEVAEGYDSWDDALQEANLDLQEAYNKNALMAESKQDLDQLRDEGKVNDQAYDRALESMHNKERMDGIDSEELKQYTDHLQEMAAAGEKTSKTGKKLSDTFFKNEQNAKDVAVATLRLNKGIQSLSDNWKNWSKTLKTTSNTAPKYVKALNDTKKAVADLLDVSSDGLSDKFIEDLAKSKDKMAIMEKAAKGDKEAIEKLRDLSFDDFVINLKIKGAKEKDVKKLKERFTTLRDHLKKIEKDSKKIKIGDNLIDTKKIKGQTKTYVDNLNEMIAKTKMSKEEVREAFKKMNYKVTFKKDRQTLYKKVPDTKVTHHKIKNYKPGSKTSGGEDIPATWDEETSTEVVKKGGWEKVTDEVGAQAIHPADTKVVPEIETIKKMDTGGAAPPDTSGSSSGGGGGGTKKHRSSTPTNKEKLEKVEKVEKPEKEKFDKKQIDRYWQLNQTIGKLTNAINKLNKEYDYLYGNEKIKNLETQNKLLNKQYENYVKLGKEQAKERVEKQEQGSRKYGATFDEQGYLANDKKIAKKQIAKLDKAREKYNKDMKKAAEDEQKANKIAMERIKNKKENRIKKTDSQKTKNKKIKNINKEYENKKNKNHQNRERTEKEAKKDLEAAENSYQNYETWHDRYGTLTQSEIPDTYEKLRDAKRQIVENNVSIINYKYEFSLNEKKFKSDLRRLINETKNMLNFTVHFNFDSKELQDNTKDIKDQESLVRQAADNIVRYATIYSNWDIYKLGAVSPEASSQSEAKQKYEDWVNKLKESGDTVKSLAENSLSTYQSKVNLYIEAWDKINNELIKQKTLLESNKQIIQLTYGDKNYAKMKKYYENISKYNKVQIQFYKTEKEGLEEQLKNIEKIYKDLGKAIDPNDIKTWTEEYIQIRDAIAAADEKIQQSIIDSLQNEKERRDNSVQAALQTLEKSITPDGISWQSEQWERGKKASEQYLDDVEKIYNIQTLMNKIDQSINTSKEVKYVQKLKSLREQELKYLSKKDKLTQHDIDMANARYEIALKEIALEEAQNNKNTIKLVRNEQGNWTYQYVTDQNDILSKQQDLINAQYNYYDKAKQYEKSSTSELLSTLSEMLNKIQEIETDDNLDDKTKKAHTNEIIDYYTDTLTMLAQEINQADFDMISGQMGVLLKQYGIDPNTLQFTIDSKLNNIFNELKDSFGEDINNFQSLYDNFGGYSEETGATIIEKLDEFFKNKDNSLNFSQWYKMQMDKGEILPTSLTEIIGSFLSSVYNYNTSDNNLGNIFGTSEIGNIINKILSGDFEEMIELAKNKMNEANGKYTEISNKYLTESNKGVLQFNESLKTVEGSMKSFAKTSNESMKKIIEDWKEAKKTIDIYYISLDNKPKGLDEASQKLTNEIMTGDKSKQATVKTPEWGTNGEYLQYTHMSTASGGWDLGFNGLYGKDGVNYILYRNKDQEYEIYKVNDDGSISKSDNLGNMSSYDIGEKMKDYTSLEVEYNDGTIKIKQFFDKINGKSVLYNVGDILQYDTGGYTGSWGDEGKIAMLHQKELVLNQSDTESILAAVDGIRSLSSINKSVTQSIADSVSDIVINSMQNLSSGTFRTTEQKKSEGIVIENVTAEFPNAENVNEIREAILNLPRIASQYVSRNFR